MKSMLNSFVQAESKAPTGIEGLDDITNGGLPSGRTTLLVGGPGSGKTLFVLRFLVNGAQKCMEPGIFVAFEEHSKRIIANSEGPSSSSDCTSRKARKTPRARLPISARFAEHTCRTRTRSKSWTCCANRNAR